MLAWSTETKRRADDAATATKKKAEDAEQARLLAIEQQRQHDEAAAKAADEERVPLPSHGPPGNMHYKAGGHPQPRRRADSSPRPPPAAGAATCHRPRCQLFQHLRSARSIGDGRRLPQGRHAVTADLNATVGAADLYYRQQLEFGTAQDSSKVGRAGDLLRLDEDKSDSMVPQVRAHAAATLRQRTQAPRYLYSRSGGACQAWLDNLLSKYGVVAADLHTKISWDDLKAAWHKRFQVESPEIKALTS
ncbi:hypothetical protein CBR_g8313 [Chara braunii]|uniref:Uncharacterized protein n=1 Tax=Chara braunii TaxID=69332 RepID=A0A388KLU0_CHABU|nr:hypothetical protein CBR_g8313 [Chara braunii]|eukprot:GBG71015.1 hypothetical protein CBR_g8313 [Chara braunii]